MAASIFLYHKFYPKKGHVIYIYHDQPLRLPWWNCHSNSHNQSYHSLDGATILSWAHDPDCQHTIACDTREEGSPNHAHQNLLSSNCPHPWYYGRTSQYAPAACDDHNWGVCVCGFIGNTHTHHHHQYTSVLPAWTKRLVILSLFNGDRVDTSIHLFLLESWLSVFMYQVVRDNLQQTQCFWMQLLVIAFGAWVKLWFPCLWRVDSGILQFDASWCRIVIRQVCGGGVCELVSVSYTKSLSTLSHIHAVHTHTHTHTHTHKHTHMLSHTRSISRSLSSLSSSKVCLTFTLVCVCVCVFVCVYVSVCVFRRLRWGCTSARFFSPCA